MTSYLSKVGLIEAAWKKARAAHSVLRRAVDAPDASPSIYEREVAACDLISALEEARRMLEGNQARHIGMSPAALDALAALRAPNTRGYNNVAMGTLRARLDAASDLIQALQADR